MKNTYKIILLLLFLSLVSSCGWIQGHVSDEEVEELHKNMGAVKRKTVMDESLVALGQLLQGYGIQETPIQSKNIGNYTADQEVPTNLYMMMASAINKIGYPIRFIPFDVQYIIDENVTGANMINRIFPVAVIAGGITGINKDMIDKSRSGEASGGWAGASGEINYEAEGKATRVSLDLNMLDYKTMAYFPGVVSSISTTFNKTKLGWGIGAYYMEFGLAFDSSVVENPTIYAALRVLVELGAIEVLGKYFEVPYWKCLPNGEENKQFVERVKDSFENASDEVQTEKLKRLMFLHGYEGLDRSKNEFTSGENQILSNAMRTHNARTYGELYIALWKTVDINAGKTRMQQEEKYEKMRRKHEAEKEEMERKNKELEEKQKEQLKQQRIKEQNQKIDKILKDAADDYNKRNYPEAIKKYEEALDIQPNRNDIKAQIKNIKGLIAQEKKNKVDYANLIKQADSYFQKDEYDAAKIMYEKALIIEPSEKYPQKQLDIIRGKNKHKVVNSIGNLSEDEW